MNAGSSNYCSYDEELNRTLQEDAEKLIAMGQDPGPSLEDLQLEVVEAARELLVSGLRLTPDGLIVREKKDNSDPHYRLCLAIEELDRKL
jgi:hypothetical protein